MRASYSSFDDQTLFGAFVRQIDTLIIFFWSRHTKRCGCVRRVTDLSPIVEGTLRAAVIIRFDHGSEKWYGIFRPRGIL